MLVFQKARLLRSLTFDQFIDLNAAAAAAAVAIAIAVVVALPPPFSLVSGSGGGCGGGSGIGSGRSDWDWRGGVRAGAGAIVLLVKEEIVATQEDHCCVIIAVGKLSHVVCCQLVLHPLGMNIYETFHIL